MRLFGLFLIIFAHASTCFKLGSEYTYNFVNEVNSSNLFDESTPASYRLEGAINVANIWRNGDEMIFQFRLISTKLLVKSQKTAEFDEKSSTVLEKVSPKPFFVVFRDSQIVAVHLEEGEDDSVSNLKKAIVSFFQYKGEDGTEKVTDVSGECDVSYIVWSPEKFSKTKLHCRLGDDLPNYQRLDYPLGVTVDPFSNTDYWTGVDGTVKKIEGHERHVVTVNAYPKVGTVVNSTFTFDISEAVGEADLLKCASVEECVKLFKNVKETELMSKVTKSCQDGKCWNLIQEVKALKDDLRNSEVGTSASARAFVKLVPMGRLAKAEIWHRILNSQSGKEIKGQLLDILAAVQTYDAFKEATNVVKFESEDDFNDAERYLQGLSVGTRPEMRVMEELLKFAQNGSHYERLQDTLVQTLAAMTYRHARLLGDDFQNSFVTKVTEFIMSQLKNCETDECKVIFLRALGNLKAPNTISMLFEYAETGSYKVSTQAVKALKAFSVSFWNTPEFRARFEDIFYQTHKKFDSSARTLALDVLLDLKLNVHELTKLVNYLRSDDKAFEIKQYVLQKLSVNAATSDYYRHAMLLLVKNDRKVNNYHVLGQKGLSTAIMRDFSKSPSFNGTLLSVQEIKDGVLKRGNADVFVQAGQEKFSIFTLGLFGNGLSSFMGGSDEQDPDEDTTVTAGMELYLQGTAMRPLVFFTGQGELMGHVWSGTASEPTPAYQAISTLQDHEEVIRLHNGAHLEVSAMGAVSIDLNGQIAISLWNRNADTKVAQNTGFATSVESKVVSSFTQLSVSEVVEERPCLNLDSTIDFSGTVALCLQLHQPQTTLKSEVTKKLTIPKSKKPYKSIARQSYKYEMSGFTHFLNHKNNEMCNKINSN
ncbi:microsomal triacylglycerol transfer protein-like [Culicoides brevitarsis]|uniref:microsomal triacylglycerol transfer protein-like n=1 Tax=Culicoides brevitarsis TaxID=469753 RepID=UPI00307CBA84